MKRYKSLGNKKKNRRRDYLERQQKRKLRDKIFIPPLGPPRKLSQEELLNYMTRKLH